jgi:hypothetical protein
MKSSIMNGKLSHVSQATATSRIRAHRSQVYCAVEVAWIVDEASSERTIEGASMMMVVVAAAVEAAASTLTVLVEVEVSPFWSMAT